MHRVRPVSNHSSIGVGVVLSGMALGCRGQPAESARPITQAAPDPTATAPSPKAERRASERLANPASVHCEKLGGHVEIEQGPGGERGICVFASGKRCEEWDLYRGRCAP